MPDMTDRVKLFLKSESISIEAKDKEQFLAVLDLMGMEYETPVTVNGITLVCKPTQGDQFSLTIDNDKKVKECNKISYKKEEYLKMARI